MLSPADIASMTATVASSLDTTVTVTHDTSKVEDAWGHTTSGGTTSFSAQVNAYKPTAPQLATYAGIIGTREAYMLRFTPTTDIREGDKITYQGEQWLVQSVETGGSYSFSNAALMTVIS